MTQLSLFSQAELADMRDRTKSRNYSPERDAFRRDHQRRRDHGKAQRHAARIYQAFQQSCDDEVPPIPVVETTSTHRAVPPADQ
jgi:hypothetical protein